MARKVNPEKAFKTSFIRTYHHNLNNPEKTAAAFGISEDKVNEILHNIGKGAAPADRGEILGMMENRSRAESLYFGDNNASEVYRREGPNYIMIDYTIEPGTQIPADIQDKANGYQIIISGRDDKGKRKVTTSIAYDIDSAASAAAALMAEYGRFKSTDAVIRVFIPVDESDYYD